MLTPFASQQEADSLLTVKQAAEILGLATGTVYNLRSAGRFAPAIVIGKSVRWERADVLAWARAFKEGQPLSAGSASQRKAAV
ncbi:helix-turn-helix transcriptional regulator [Leifsonia sp. EB34]|jgi:excisionase family DNA binding protein|uniref:helix-turn-helix transcriptional regulator n=1 Tax=Leifsonia sp. EB34 TaxID=3156303 RepID=UPI00351806DE